MENFTEHDFKAAVKEITEKVAKFEDFPKKGVCFFDLFSLLYDPVLRELVFKSLLYIIRRDFSGKFDAIGGLEARGLALGLHLAEILKVPFIAFRKPGKLPGVCISATFTKEYGSDSFEAQKHSIKKSTRILLIDDLLATGGSFSACDTIIEKCEGVVAGYLVVFLLSTLHGEKKLKNPGMLKTLIDVDY